jgi:hypothetical protein
MKGVLDAGVEALKEKDPKAAAKAEASKEAALAAAVQDLRSAPFRAAAERAVMDAPQALTDMLAKVSLGGYALLVPAAASERLLATFFEAKIGGAPEARRGLSGAFAQMATDALFESVAALPRRNGWLSKPTASVVVGEGGIKAHHLFRVEQEFSWGPRRRRGYLLGRAVGTYGVKPGRGVDRPASGLPDVWTAGARELEERLGAMTKEGREALFEGWQGFTWRHGGVAGPGDTGFLRNLR